MPVLITLLGLPLASYFFTDGVSMKRAEAVAIANAKPALVPAGLPLRAGLSPDRRATLGGDESSLANTLAAYAQLTGRTLLPRRRGLPEKLDDVVGRRFSRWGWVKRSRIPTPVQFHNDGLYSVAEVKQRIEEVLRVNGIVIVPEGKSGFWAVPVGSLKRRRFAGPISGKPRINLMNTNEGSVRAKLVIQ